MNRKSDHLHKNGDFFMNKTKHAGSVLKMTSSQYDEIVLLIFIPKKEFIGSEHAMLNIKILTEDKIACFLIKFLLDFLSLMLNLFYSMWM